MNYKRSPFRVIGNSMTPSRNKDYIKGKVNEGDRYVAIRNDDQLELARHLFSKDSGLLTINSSSSPSSAYSPTTQQQLLSLMRVKRQNDDGEDRICAYRKGLAPTSQFGAPKQVLYSCMNPSSSCVKKSRRYIKKDPEKMLDVPTYKDDFYTNLLDWSSRNIVAVALGQKIYAWSAESGNVDVIVDYEGQDNVDPTVLKWSSEGQYLTIGFNDGKITIFNAETKQRLRSIKSEDTRVACISWTRKGQLTFGSRTGRIYNHDVSARNSLISSFNSHEKEVCGLKWSPDENYLTSGGADGVVNVWQKSQLSTSNSIPLHSFDEFVAAVKAIDYGLAPHTVAAGGGCNDHSVKFFNLIDGSLQYKVDTQSQVVGLLFNKTFGEMITGHGLPHAGVKVWKYDPHRIKKYEPICDLNVGLTSRVLALCASPCGEFAMAASEDEIIRLWHVWKVDESVMKSKTSVTAAAHKHFPTTGNIR